MAKNQKLEEHVLSAMSSYLIKNDPTFKIMCDGEEELGKGIIKGMGELMIDKQSKIRMHFSKLIGYGYDFEGEVEGSLAKKIYERAVENTKKVLLGDLGEKFLEEKIEEDRYGLYITSV